MMNMILSVIGKERDQIGVVREPLAENFLCFFSCIYFWRSDEDNRLWYDRPLWIISDWLIFSVKKKKRKTNEGASDNDDDEDVSICTEMILKRLSFILFLFFEIYSRSKSWYLYRCCMIRQVLLYTKLRQAFAWLVVDQDNINNCEKKSSQQVLYPRYALVQANDDNLSQTNDMAEDRLGKWNKLRLDVLKLYRWMTTFYFHPERIIKRKSSSSFFCFWLDSSK